MRLPVRSCLVLHLLLMAALPAAAAAQAAAQPPQTFDWRADPVPATTPWGQQIDVESTRAILSWTTAPEYTNPLVDHLPDGGPVVSPTDHFGHPVGRPGVLHRTDEVHGYLRALAQSSPRVRFSELGETEEGNSLALVQVGSEGNLQRLERIRAGYNRLADPRATDATEAERLVRDLPVVYLITAGLHSPETGPPEMVMELAYRLAVSDDPLIQGIRDSVVTFIIPVTEPDGRNRVVDWYRQQYPTPDTVGGRRPGPPYWGKYIFHDNNRDGLQLTARLSQEVVGLIHDWRIPVAHDLHESVPYLYTSTGTGPYNPTVDPITVAEWTWFANYEVTALTALGMPGVWTHGFYDGWNPTYMIWAANTRNGMGRFYETFGNSIPWTMERTVGGQTSVEWYRPNPPRDTTMWSLRNNTNYMQTGVLTALGLAADNRARLLRQFRTKSENALRKGRTEPPFAFVVPAEQERKADTRYMIELLRRQGIEVHRAVVEGTFDAEPPVAPRTPTTDGTVTVRPGDVVIRMDQPYRNLILTLMEVQDFPADAPRPYDDVAWTFPLMFGATVHPVTDSAVLALDVAPLEAEVRMPGTVAGEGAWWLVRPVASAHAMAARLDLGRSPVWAVREPVVLGGDAGAVAGGAVLGVAVPEDDAPTAGAPDAAAPDAAEGRADTIAAGAWLVRARDLPAARAREWAGRFGLDLVAVSDSLARAVPRHELDLPRIAILHTWRSTQPEGWVRYTFDHFGVPYDYISETELRTLGRLKRRWDVIVFPDQGGDARAIFEGIDPKWSPLPYRRGRDAPSLGFPDATDDMTGGMRHEGLIALRDFVDDGGTFIALRAASAVPVDFGLVRGVTTRPTPDGLFVPGSLVRGEVARPDHPIAYGYDTDIALHHRFGPYLRVDSEREDAVVVRYGTGDIRLSGLVQNGARMAGEPAVLSVPSGQGHYVLFGFNPLNRHQNFMDFALVWNAILNWDDLPGPE